MVNSTTATDPEAGLIPPHKKQKRQEDGEKVTGLARFKVVGHLVLAMKRFQDSINPTYTYGKKPKESSPVLPNAVLVQPKGKSLSSASPTRSGDRATSGRTASGRPLATSANHHGHKAALLFSPLNSKEEQASS